MIHKKCRLSRKKTFKDTDKYCILYMIQTMMAMLADGGGDSGLHKNKYYSYTDLDI